jgi:hypothetical protein
MKNHLQLSKTHTLHLQASYAKTNNKTQDETHKENIFDYGYIGKFVQTKEKSYASRIKR